MAKQKIAQKINNPVPKHDRTIDRLFAQYAAYHQHPTNKLLQKIFVPLFFFGLFALVWAIPFPHLNFLGRYNGFVNWASFLIAFSIYYYYKLSPVLSYFILFTFFGFSYGIIQLERWQHVGGGRLWEVGLVLFIGSLIGMFIGYGADKKDPGYFIRLKHIFTAPAFLWHLILNKFSIKF